MPSPIPRQELRRDIARLSPALAAFPSNGFASAPALPISGPHRLFTWVAACTLAGHPKGDLCVEGFDGFVTSTVASTATHLERSVAGRVSHPTKDFLLFTAHALQRLVIRQLYPQHSI